MPTVAYTAEMSTPLDTVWAFIRDMNNWAPFLTGYQTHEILDATDSLWTLKGEVGILSRRVELRAHVTEWVEPERVAFTLTGVNEVVEGGGTLVLRRGHRDAAALRPVPSRSWFQRLIAWLMHRVFGRSVDRPAALPSSRVATETVSLEFTLTMDAGGPAGPLVNAMLGPALEPAVEDLAKKIAAHLGNDAAQPVADASIADARHARPSP